MFRIIHLPTAEYVVSEYYPIGSKNLMFKNKQEAIQYFKQCEIRYFKSNWYAITNPGFDYFDKNTPKYLFDIVEVDDV